MRCDPSGLGYASESLWEPLRAVGEKLASGEMKDFAMVLNQRENHWHSVVIDIPNKYIGYANSWEDGLIDERVKQTVKKWLVFHGIEGLRPMTKMAVTRQVDGNSCLFLAWNALMHYYNSVRWLLYRKERRYMALTRARLFCDVANHHLQAVRFS